MAHFDLIIIGGGMVGLSLAASLKDSPIQIALIENNPPTEKQPVPYRVSAINLANQQWLTELNAWQQMDEKSPYQKMKVWEKDSFAHIEFDSQSLGLQQLGHIISNDQIQQALWQQVASQKNCQIYPALCQRISINPDNALLLLENGEFLTAKLIVGADGANSWLRKQADIPLVFQDYGHHALVCNVSTAEPHQHCARQIFNANSILAFLPLSQQNQCSIVWSMPPEKAQQLKQCDETEFNKALSIAFDQQLGLCKLITKRECYPLTARYARNFAQPRIALIGDSAHTIHPLAGLGVNLGFQDAKFLSEQIQLNLSLNKDIGEYRNLRLFERKRKVEAIKMLATMQGLKDIFQGDHPLKKLIRGIGISATNKATIIKDQLIRQAIGL